MTTIGITGHRLLDNTKEVCDNLRLSLAYFHGLHPELTAISSLAEGADTLFAQAATDAGIPLRIILPFALEEYKKDFSAAGLKELKKILKDNNDAYEIVTETAIDTALRRNDAYLTVGKKVVDESDIVIAVWDEEESRGKGGTSDIVAYTRTKKDKVLHIIKGIRKGTAVDGDPPHLLKKYDRLAILFKKGLFELTWLSGLVIAELAVVFFAVGLTFKTVLDEHQQFTLTKLEVGCIAISIILLKVVANWLKGRFLKYRKNTEYLRMLYWYDEAEIPLEVNQPDKSGTKTIFDDVLSIELALSLKKRAPINLHNMKRVLWCLSKDQWEYQSKRIAKKHGQIETTEKIFDWIKILFLSIIAVRFIYELDEHYAWGLVEQSGCITLMHEVDRYLGWGFFEQFGDIKFVFNFAIIWLPSMLAVVESAKYFAGWDETIKTSERISKQLETQMLEIKNAADEKELLAIANQVRKIMDDENREWLTDFEHKEVDIAVF